MKAVTSILILTLSTLGLTGCYFSTKISASTLEKGSALCSQNGGILVVKTTDLNKAEFHCVNGAVFTLMPTN